MNSLHQYLIPWLVSQTASGIILFLAWKKPVVARYLFVLIFLLAGLFNWYTVLTKPEAYLAYAQTAAGLYREFINGWFSRNLVLAVGSIATGQIFLAIALLAGRKWLAFGCLGIIIFLLAIAPLGIGSAFPFSITVSIAAYFVYRHWQTRWGATEAEVRMPLPGDDIVCKPDFVATRGITIHAPAGNIFPWIVQIGSGRAGWYSLDRLDNGGIPSSRIILKDFQELKAGQFIPFTPDQKNGMWVKEFESNKFILWTDEDGKASWCWYLIPLDENRSRLLTRLRTQYNWRSLWIIYYLIYDFGDIVMMANCMKGIKARAEEWTQSKTERRSL